MRSAVRERWIEFTEPLEGGVPYFYADIRGLITIAYGNLVDPLSLALGLPMKRPDGSDATTTEITAAWLAVKGDPKAPTWGHTYARTLTSLRLTRDGMSTLALGRLELNDHVLRRRLSNWDDLPACAQMALHSLAWACGPEFHFPKLLSAVLARDFEAASVHIHMNEWTPEGKRNAGLVPRNVANKLLMRNAERVQSYKLDPDTIEWHHLIGVEDLDTQPDLPNPASEPTVYIAEPDQPIVHPRLYDEEWARPIEIHDDDDVD